ncbi:MAG: sodium:solute symporter family protein [Capsulimonadales bacterium]|nr:sodium:solute symporter family protein [Capsulimonadales bacterium]
MIPAIIVFCYLAIVLYIGIFAFRKGASSGEDFFLANRRLGPMVFLLSLFGTNMTAVAILGSSGFAYQRGIGVYGLMASSSGIIIPLTLFFIGTRLWALGKRFGHMTQVQYLRDRWEMRGIGTFIFALTAVMLVPYIIIGVMGGGETLETISGGAVPYEVGGAVVAIVVMSYVFFGGMRGTAWVNTFQTVLFLCFGAIAFTLIAQSLGGFPGLMNQLAASPKAYLLSRERIPPEEFLSYMFIPLSSIMFPHIAIMCMTAEKITHFKRTVIFYPLCIMFIWLPSVYLGVVAATQYPNLTPGQANDVIIRLLTDNTNTLVSGILGAGIMACVMASDSQILALSTMFTEDLFSYYGGRAKYGPKAEVWAGRAFIVAISVVAYGIALLLKDRANIFDLAIRFAFSGFAALAPVMLAALFWKRSTKWGALAASIWVLFGVLGIWYLTAISDPIAPRPPAPRPAGTAPPGRGPSGTALTGPATGQTGPGSPTGPTASAGGPPTGGAGRPAGGGPPRPPSVRIFPQLGDLFLRGPINVTIFGFLPVMPMVLGSALLMIVVSLLTRPPSQATLDRYFPPKND